MMDAVKSFVIGLAGKAGYVVTPRWRAFRDPQVQYFRRLFAMMDVDCVIDVGANEGQFGRFLRSEVGYAGPILSFEPNPVAAAKARAAAAADPTWSIHELALGREAGRASFNIMMADQYSSFLGPAANRPAIDHVVYGTTVERSIEVEVLRADDVLPQLLAEIGARRPYLKLDTQGFDLEVVAGAPALLRTVVGCQTEVAVTQIYSGAPTFDQTVAAFDAAGFAASGLFPTNDAFPALIDMDLHLIRRDLVGDKAQI